MLQDADQTTSPPSLSGCEVWIGSSHAAHAGSVAARLDELDEAALLRRDGIAVVYIPLAPNARRAPGFDPASISTWRREVSDEESQALLATAEVSSPPYSNSIRSAYILGWLTYLFTGQL